jgi:hypothetical protein
VADYIIRDIDDEMWRTVKSKAALEGTTVKDILLNLIAAYSEKKTAVVPVQPKAKRK